MDRTLVFDYIVISFLYVTLHPQCALGTHTGTRQSFPVCWMVAPGEHGQGSCSFCLCVPLVIYLSTYLFRYHGYITLCKFKECNMLVWHFYMLQYDHHGHVTLIPLSCHIIIISFVWWEPLRSSHLTTLKFIVLYCWLKSLCSALGLQDLLIS